MILVQNCRMIDPASQTDGLRDILIGEDRITKIAEAGTINPAQITKEKEDELRILNADGLIAAPGLVDTHVHFRDPGAEYKEDILTGAVSAAAGGVTSVVLMANTNPHVDQEETLSYVLEKGAKTGIHVYTCANVTMDMEGDELTDMEALAKAGAVGFTDDGKPLLDAKIARKAMQEAARVHKPISFHEENPAYIQNNGVNAGKASEYFGIGGSDRQAEIDMVRRDLSIALETGAEIVIQHISAAEAVELVRQAKKKSTKIHAEATPHHFTLTEDAVIAHGTMAKMNPPLRDKADREALLEGLADGTIDMIATDHAPHSAGEKGRGLEKSAMGIVGLETAFPLLYTHLVKPGVISFARLMELLHDAPCRRFGIGPDTGFTVFDLGAAYRIDPADFLSCGKATPFTGWNVEGRCLLTSTGETIAWQDAAHLPEGGTL